ncbi:MAG: hypothetical protein HC893_17065 [Chloroflexaceae bacterium]|nr:hypothetical protein [Chloroflexaceae bacterium]
MQQPESTMGEVLRVPDTQRDRYATLDFIGWWDRERVRGATVLVVGVGALGNEVIKNLALMGIGRLLLGGGSRGVRRPRPVARGSGPRLVRRWSPSRAPGPAPGGSTAGRCRLCAGAALIDSPIGCCAVCSMVAKNIPSFCTDFELDCYCQLYNCSQAQRLPGTMHLLQAVAYVRLHRTIHQESEKIQGNNDD